MSDRNKLIVGLADSSIGTKVANVVANVTASGTATTLGASTGALGFFASAPTTQQGVTLNNVTSVAQALINLGLASENS